jgi:hypothetical protein
MNGSWRVPSRKAFNHWDILWSMNSAASDEDQPERAVRRYLLFLDDPAQLRDEAELQRKTQSVLDAEDPIEKLKAIAELERVASIDEEPLRSGFVTHALAWAGSASVPVSSFRELGVPDEVLREAGFEVPLSPVRSRARRPEGSEGRQRAKAVPVEQVKAFILTQEGNFILTDVISGVGGSPATVRKAIDELIDAGQVQKLGPVPGYQGRGRAPHRYSVT